MRYTRIRGPQNIWTVPSSLTPPPGFSVTRVFGVGPLDLTFSCWYENQSFNANTVLFDFQVDGVNQHPFQSPRHIAQINDDILITLRLLVAPIPGLHTVQPVIRGNGQAGNVLIQGGTEFVLIELPSWDDDAEIITL